MLKEHATHFYLEDGCNCAETLKLIEEGKIDTTPLITGTAETDCRRSLF